MIGTNADGLMAPCLNRHTAPYLEDNPRTPSYSTHYCLGGLNQKRY